MALPSDIPSEAIPILEEMGYLEEDRLKVGDSVPCLTLTNLLSGVPTRIGEPNALLPTVLVFGSYT